MNDRYVIIGNPVSHSISPLVHKQFAQQTQQALDYDLLEAPLDSFEKTLKQFVATGGKGGNITMPFKEQAFALCNQLSERARLAGAVNTFKVEDSGQLFGDNTDGIGLVNDLQNNNIVLRAKKILLLGAGGAARGAIIPLLEQQPTLLYVANRTAQKAVRLVAQFGEYGALQGGGFNDIPTQPFDVVINATGASASDSVPDISSRIITPQTGCYDMYYSKERETAFVTWARNLGAQICLDGRGMVAEQAAESFYVWRGVRPDTQPVLAMLSNKRPHTEDGDEA